MAEQEQEQREIGNVDVVPVKLVTHAHSFDFDFDFENVNLPNNRVAYCLLIFALEDSINTHLLHDELMTVFG